MFGTVLENQTAGEHQFAVQPGIEQRSAVNFNACLPPSVGTDGWLWLELETGGIGVGTKDMEAAGRGSCFWLHPGNDRSVADDVVRAGTQVPGLLFVQSVESNGIQAFRGRGCSVVARWRGCDVFGQVCNVGHCCGLCHSWLLTSFCQEIFVRRFSRFRFPPEKSSCPPA